MIMRISGIKDDIVRSEMEDYGIGYTAVVVIAYVDGSERKMYFTKMTEKDCNVQYIFD